LDVVADHELQHALGDVLGHAVVQAPTGEDDLGAIADFLGLVRQIVRVDADAVAADEAGPEIQEVPLRAGRLQHFLGIDVEPLEDHRQLVDQRDIDVALRVLDDLGSLGHLQARRLVRAGRDDRAVERVDVVGGLRRRARCDLLDRRQPVFLVAGIDALRAIAGEEIPVELEPRPVLEDRHAELLGAAGIDGRRVDDDVAVLEQAADGRRHGDDERVAVGERLAVRRELEVLGRFELLARRLERRVGPPLELRDAVLLDVEADRREMLAELYGQGEPDVAKADDANTRVAYRAQKTLPRCLAPTRPYNAHAMQQVYRSRRGGSAPRRQSAAPLARRPRTGAPRPRPWARARARAAAGRPSSP